MTHDSAYLLAQRLYRHRAPQLDLQLRSLDLDLGKKVADVYDLAELLLSEPVRKQVLAKSSRYELFGLVNATETIERSALISRLQQQFSKLSERALNIVLDRLDENVLLAERGDRFRLWPEHIATVQALWEGLDTKAPKHPSLPSSNTYEYLHALSDLFHLIRAEPVKLKANGEPTESEFTRLSASLPPVMKPLLRITLDTVANTKLMWRRQKHLHTTAEADVFLQQSTAEQWLRLAKFWKNLLPELLMFRLIDTDDHLSDMLHWLYPLDQSPIKVLPNTLVQLGEVIGLLTAGIPTAALKELIQDETPKPESALAEKLGSFPPDSSGLYVQTDLSAIAAGPIPNSLDYLLRVFADKEGLGIAPRYRFSAESLNRAWRRGYRPEQLRVALEQASIAEVPGSLSYLIDDSYQTMSNTVIEPVAGGTIVHSDPLRITELRISPRLARFRWQPTADGLFTLSDASAVSDALWAAGYPARLDHTEDEPQAEDVEESVDQSADFERILSTSQEPDAASWALKQLNNQLGSKQPLQFTVVLPQGEMQFRMVPLGIAAGRIRARDIDAETERTLPLSAITKIEPIEAAL